MSSLHIPLRCLTVPALIHFNATGCALPAYASSAILSEPLDSSPTQSLSTERLRTTIRPLPLLPPSLPQSPPPLLKNLPPNVTYCDPAPPSVLHWTKPPVFDNSSSYSINSVEVASTLSNDTDLLDCPFIGLLRYLPETKPTKRYALAPHFPMLTGDEKPLRFRIRQLLDEFRYTRMQILQLAIPSKTLLDFKYSLIEGVEFEFTFDTYCFEDESIELSRAVRFGGLFHMHYEYHFVALLNIVNWKMGQVLLLALDKEKGYIGMESPVLPPIILNIPIRYISFSLLHTYTSRYLFFYKALIRIQDQCCM